MIFFLNLDGTCTRQDTDHIYQGSNNVSKVVAVTSISPAQSVLQVAFTLPSGVTYGYIPMSPTGEYKVDGDEETIMYLWEYKLTNTVTYWQGTVGVSFNVVNSITQNNMNMTSYTSTFEVEYSALPLPTSVSNREIEEILNLLNAYYVQNTEITKKISNFKVGTVTTKTAQAGTDAKVSAAIVDDEVDNSYQLNMDFELPQGAKGDKGDTGATPNVSVSASVDNNVGTPSVTVTKGGTVESPTFALSFKNLKGNTGSTGAQGHGYYRVNASLTTSSTTVEKRLVNPTNATLLVSDTLVDNNGMVFAVTKATASTDSSVSIAYRSTIKGAVARILLDSSDNIDNITSEGYYCWSTSAPQNSPCAPATMVVMYASSSSWCKQIVFRQGSKTLGSNGEYTSDEIWMRSRDNNTKGFTPWTLIPTDRFLSANYMPKTAFTLNGTELSITTTSEVMTYVDNSEWKEDNEG